MSTSAGWQDAVSRYHFLPCSAPPLLLMFPGSYARVLRLLHESLGIRLPSSLTLLYLVIMNRKPQQAWELYLRLETSADSFSLLQLIANDCYKVSGQS